MSSWNYKLGNMQNACLQIKAQGPYCPYPRPKDYPAGGYRFPIRKNNAA